MQMGKLKGIAATVFGLGVFYNVGAGIAMIGDREAYAENWSACKEGNGFRCLALPSAMMITMHEQHKLQPIQIRNNDNPFMGL